MTSGTTTKKFVKTFVVKIMRDLLSSYINDKSRNDKTQKMVRDMIELSLSSK